MSDRGLRPVEPAPARSHITFVFGGPGSSDMTVAAENVGPGQVYEAAKYLELYAALVFGQATAGASAGAIVAAAAFPGMRRT